MITTAEIKHKLGKYMSVSIRGAVLQSFEVTKDRPDVATIRVTYYHLKAKTTLNQMFMMHVEMLVDFGTVGTLDSLLKIRGRQIMYEMRKAAAIETAKCKNGPLTRS